MALTRIVSVLALLAVGCGSDPRTEVLVVVDTDMAVPAALDTIEIAVTGPAGNEKQGGGPITAEALPATLGLVHGGGELGPFTAEARGLSMGAVVVTRTARFSFIPERTLVLEMHLVADCVAASCAADQSCTERGCESIDVGPEALSEWTGTPPRLGTEMPPDASVEEDAGEQDAGGVDAGAPDGCTAGGVEVCNGLDDNCDGVVDEGFDRMTDPMNCGACGMVCLFQNGSGTCSAGSCVIESCNMGFDDCDGDASNGCEADLTAATTCGSCANECRPPNRVCCAGACARDCP